MCIMPMAQNLLFTWRDISQLCDPWGHKQYQDIPPERMLTSMCWPVPHGRIA